jgi:hypothetical protein
LKNEEQEQEKEGRPMFKRTLRWLMPLMVLLMLAAWLVFSPMLISHAAGITPAAPTHISSPAGPGALPNIRWQNK